MAQLIRTASASVDGCPISFIGGAVVIHLGVGLRLRMSRAEARSFSQRLKVMLDDTSVKRRRAKKTP